MHVDTSTPKRKRWFRLRNIFLAIALIVVGCVTWVGIEVWRLSNAEPVIAVNYREQFRQKSMQLAGITAEEGERSWALMASTVKMARDVEDGSVNFSHVRKGRNTPGNIEKEREALRLLRERGFFDALQQLESMPPGLGPTVNNEAIFVQSMPGIGGTRSAAEALTASMRIEADQQDYDEVLRNFAAMLALARTDSLHVTIIGGLVAVAVNSMALGELRSILMEHQFSAEQYQHTLAVMEQHKPAGVSHSLEAERATFHDAIQWMFTDDGRGDGYVIPGVFEDFTNGRPVPRSGLNVSSALSSRFVLAKRRETLSTYDQFVDQLQKEAAQRPSERWKSTFDPSGYVQQLPQRHLVLRVLLPALGKAVNSWDRAAVEWEGTRLMIHFEMFRAKNGAYPVTLEALVPAAEATVPLDPLQGKPWGYRLLEGDEHERSYLLYSRGFDGEDDGGLSDPDNPFAAIRDRDAAGVDFILNPPREAALD